MTTLGEVAAEILRTGSTASILDRITSFEGRNEITGLATYMERDATYATPDPLPV